MCCSITNGILFGIAMSIAFYFTTGNFLTHMRAYSRLPVKGPDGQPIDVPSTPIFDGRTMERRPSLILARADLQ